MREKPYLRRSWRPSFWGTMERHYKNVSRAVTALSVLSLYVVSENLAIWGWEIRSNQLSLALGLKLLPLFVITARMSIFKYHWSVGTPCGKGYTNIPKSIFPALERLPFSSLRSEKSYKVSKSIHMPLGDTQVHLSQRCCAGHSGETAAQILRASPEVHTEQEEAALIPSWLSTETANALESAEAW